MAFKTKCPNCGQHYELEDEYAGMPVECSKCQKGFIAHKEPAQNQPQPTPKPAKPELPKNNDGNNRVISVKVVGVEMSFKQVFNIVLKVFLANLLLGIVLYAVFMLIYAIIRDVS
ncbi:MAG: hypothetical protein AB7F40_04330 [Victivallaceae bacterium]